MFNREFIITLMICLSPIMMINLDRDMVIYTSIQVQNNTITSPIYLSFHPDLMRKFDSLVSSFPSSRFTQERDPIYNSLPDEKKSIPYPVSINPIKSVNPTFTPSSYSLNRAIIQAKKEEIQLLTEKLNNCLRNLNETMLKLNTIEVEEFRPTRSAVTSLKLKRDVAEAGAGVLGNCESEIKRTILKKYLCSVCVDDQSLCNSTIKIGSVSLVKTRKKREIEINKYIPLEQLSDSIRPCAHTDDIIGEKEIFVPCHMYYNFGRTASNILCLHNMACTIPTEIIEDRACTIPKLTDKVIYICSHSILRVDDNPKPYSREFFGLDNRVCSLDGYDIKKCDKSNIKTLIRKVSIVKINNLFHTVTMDHHYLFREDPSNIKNYQCTGGNPMFMKDKRCSGLPSNDIDLGLSNCTCSKLATGIYGTLHLIIGGEKIPVNMLLTRTMTLEVENDFIESSKPRTLSCIDCEVSCDRRILFLKSMPKKVSSIKVCNKHGCYRSDSKPVILLPMEIVLMSKNLDVSIYDSDSNLLKTFNVQCKITSNCDLIDCRLCLNKLLNPDCYDILDFFSIGTICMLSVLILWFISLILKIILSILKLVSYLIKILGFFLKSLRKIYYFCQGKTIKKVRVVFKKMETLDENLTKETIFEEPREVVTNNYAFERQRKRSMLQLFMIRSPTAPMTIILLFLILMPIVLCCTHSNVVVLEDQDCEMINGALQCTMRTNFAMDLPGFGGDSCMLIKSAGGNPVGSLRYKISDIRIRCMEEHLYYTFEPSVYTSKECLCFTNSFCNNHECSNYDGSQAVEGVPKLKNVGKAQCSLLKSNWWGKCFLGLEGCCIITTELRTGQNNFNYSVKHCPTYQWEIDIKKQVIVKGINEVETISLTAGVSRRFKEGSLILSSVSEATLTEKNKCIVERIGTNESAVINCSKEDSLIKGIVGEVRCSSIPLNSTLGCRFADGVIKHTIRGFSIDSEVSTIDLRGLFNSRRIPLNTPYYSVNKDENGYFFKHPMSTMFTLTGSLSELKLQPFHNSQDCSVSFKGLAGCYGCPLGSELKLKVTCDNYPALGVISCPSIKAQTPFVSESKKEVIIKLQLMNSKIDEVCNITISKQDLSIRLVGVLLKLDPYEIKTLYETDTVSSVVSPVNWLSLTYNWVLNLFEAFIELIKTLWFKVTLVSWIGLTLVIYLLFSKRGSKTHVRYKKM
nr:polyprotein [Liriomyza bunyavirus]